MWFSLQLLTRGPESIVCTGFLFLFPRHVPIHYSHSCSSCLRDKDVPGTVLGAGIGREGRGGGSGGRTDKNPYSYEAYILVEETDNKERFIKYVYSV